MFFIDPCASLLFLFNIELITLLFSFHQSLSSSMTSMQPDIDEFNSQMRTEIEHVRDFIILHYHVTERNDTPFWNYCRTMEIPDSLTHRIELFKQTGRVFRIPTELFGENSWVQVILGQGLIPEQYHSIVNMMSNEELEEFLTGIRNSAINLVNQLPEHQRFIDHYCRAMEPEPVAKRA